MCRRIGGWTYHRQSAWSNVFVVEGEAMVAIAHVMLFMNAHRVSVFWTGDKAPAPMQKQLVMVWAYWVGERGLGRLGRELTRYEVLRVHGIEPFGHKTTLL